MHHQNKHPIEILIKKILIPVLITGFFVFYAIYSKPAETEAGAAIWFLNWLMAVFFAPLLLIIEFMSAAGYDIDLGSATWLFKLILQVYYYGLFGILLLILVTEWLVS